MKPTGVTLKVERAKCIVPGCKRTEHFGRLCRRHSFLSDLGWRRWNE